MFTLTACEMTSPLTQESRPPVTHPTPRHHPLKIHLLIFFLQNAALLLKYLSMTLNLQENKGGTCAASNLKSLFPFV